MVLIINLKDYKKRSFCEEDNGNHQDSYRRDKERYRRLSYYPAISACLAQSERVIFNIYGKAY